MQRPSLFAIAGASLSRSARRAVGLAALTRTIERCVVAAGLIVVATTPSVDAAFVAAFAALVTMGMRASAAMNADLAVRSELYTAVGKALLGADAMRPLPLPGGEAEGALTDAAYASGRAIAELVPAVVSEAVTGIAFGVLLVRVLDPSLLVLVFGLAVVVAIGTVATSRSLVREEARHLEAFLDVHASLGDVVVQRETIAATAGAGEVLRGLEARLRVWRARAATSRIVAAVGTRLPVAAAFLIAAACLALRPALRATLQEIDRTTLAMLAVVVSAVIGVARSAQEIRRANPELGLLRELFALPPLERGGRKILAGPPTHLSARTLAFAYDAADVFDDVSFDWDRGRLLCFAGPNGGGKSTLLRLLLGFARPSRGAMAIASADGAPADAEDGKPAGAPTLDLFDVDLMRLRADVAYVPQRGALPRRATAREVLADTPRGLEVLAALGLGHTAAADAILDRPIATLSAGQAQRVALAKALAGERPIVVLDEPDANLDEATVDTLVTLLRASAPARLIAFAAHHPKLVACADVVVRVGER